MNENLICIFDKLTIFDDFYLRKVANNGTW